MHHRPPLAWTLGIAGLLAVLVTAQSTNLLLRVDFDGSLEGASPAGAVAPVGTAPLRVVAQRGGQGVEFSRPGALVYPLPGEGLGEAGTIRIGVQPLAGWDDGQNRRILAAGDPEQPGFLTIWKTGLHNDLRVRLHTAERWVEVVDATAATWRPGQWYHLQVLWGDGALVLLVDGKLIARAALPAGVRPQATALALGALPDGREPAMAVLDRLEVYDRAFTGGPAGNAYEQFLAERRVNLAIPFEHPAATPALDLLPPAALTYAVVSDLHIPAEGAFGGYQQADRAEAAIARLNRLRPAFVLDAGDINTSFPGRPDFPACNANALRLLAGLQPTIYHAPGNHDVGNKHQFDGARFDGWFVSPENIAVYEEAFGADHRSFSHGDLHVVLLNNQIFNSLPDRDAAQWAWLTSELAANRDKRLVVVMHNPLFWVGPDDSGDNNYETVNEPRRGEFIALCRQYGVAAVYTGHTHHAITNTIASTRYLTLPSTTFARGFGDNNGLTHRAVVWDAARVGYLIARVRDGAIVHHTVRHFQPTAPPRVLLAGAPAPEHQFVPAAAEELVAPPVGLLAAPLPTVDQPDWAGSYLIDGVSRPAPGVAVERHAWTSEAHTAGTASREEAVVTLAAVSQVTAIELWARPDGRGFPIRGQVAVRAEPTDPWTEVVAWQTVPAGISSQPLRVELGSRPVGQIQIMMTELPPMANGTRASLAEVVALDTAGGDLAVASRGATVSVTSSAAGDKRTLNDNLWQAPREIGAREVYLPGEAAPWADCPGSLSFEAVRATGLGQVPGCRIWWPVTLLPPAGTALSAATLQAYASRLASELGEGLGGLLLWVEADAAPGELPAWLAAVRRGAGRLPVAARVATVDQALALPTADRLLLPDPGDGGIARLRAARLPAPVAVILAPPTGHDPIDRARQLTNRAVALLAAGCQVVGPAAGTTDGPLNQTGTPTVAGIALAALNTLLDGAVPDSETGSFRRPDGGSVTALLEAGDNRRSVTVAAGRGYLLDPLSGRLQPLAAGSTSVTLGPEAAPVFLAVLPADETR